MSKEGTLKTGRAAMFTAWKNLRSIVYHGIDAESLIYIIITYIRFRFPRLIEAQI